MTQEYFGEAIVLDLDFNGDMDLRVSLFTLNFGKIIAKVKSARKITSKLRGHIEPANLVLYRIVSKRGFQLVDVLKQKKLNLDIKNLYLLDKILIELENEKNLYFDLKREKFDWNRILKILGWDPKESNCSKCFSKNPKVFHINSQEFFCVSCSFEIPKNELIYI